MAHMPKPDGRSTRRKPPRNTQKLVPVLARLLPAQAAAVRKEATRRMRERRIKRPDVSEVLRDAVSVWAAIRPVQRAIIRAVAERRDLTRPEVLRGALDAWLTELEPDDR
jgi:hypothetical protein